MNNVDNSGQRFAIYAESASYDKPLFMIDLTFAGLIDNVIVAYDKDEPFFIDGCSLKKSQIRRFKLLRQKPEFRAALAALNSGMRRGELQRQKMFAEQYHIRLDVLVRTNCDDVTSQLLKAYDTAIKPRLKDYMPNREALIEAAAAFFWKGVQVLGGT